MLSQHIAVTIFKGCLIYTEEPFGAQVVKVHGLAPVVYIAKMIGRKYDYHVLGGLMAGQIIRKGIIHLDGITSADGDVICIILIRQKGRNDA